MSPEVAYRFRYAKGNHRTTPNIRDRVWRDLGAEARRAMALREALYDSDRDGPSFTRSADAGVLPVRFPADMTDRPAASTPPAPAGAVAL